MKAKTLSAYQQGRKRSKKKKRKQAERKKRRRDIINHKFRCVTEAVRPYVEEKVSQVHCIPTTSLSVFTVVLYPLKEPFWVRVIRPTLQEVAERVNVLYGEYWIKVKKVYIVIVTFDLDMRYRTNRLYSVSHQVINNYTDRIVRQIKEQARK